MNKEQFKNYFDNVVGEKWLIPSVEYELTTPSSMTMKKIEKNLKKDTTICFDFQKIESLIGQTHYKNEQQDIRYIFGKYINYYFLCLFTNDEIYPYSVIYKHDTLVPLVSKISQFKILYPSMSPKIFIRNLCLQAKMEDLLLPDHSDVKSITLRKI